MGSERIRWAVALAALAGLGCGGAAPSSLGSNDPTKDSGGAETATPESGPGEDASDAGSRMDAAGDPDAVDPLEADVDAGEDADAGPGYTSLPDAGPLVFQNIVACDIGGQLYVGCNEMPVTHPTSYQVYFGGSTCANGAEMGVTTGNCPAGGGCGLIAGATGTCSACVAAAPVERNGPPFPACPSGLYVVACNAIPQQQGCVYGGGGYWCCPSVGDPVQN